MPACSRPTVLFETGMPAGTAPTLATGEAEARPRLPGQSSGSATALARSPSGLLAKVPSEPPRLYRAQPCTTSGEEPSQRPGRYGSIGAADCKDERVRRQDSRYIRHLSNDSGADVRDCKDGRVLSKNPSAFRWLQRQGVIAKRGLDRQQAIRLVA